MEEHGINSATLIVHSAKSRDSITWSQDSTLSKELIPLTRHSRNSHAKSFRIPYEEKTYLQYSFLPRTIKQWNSLPATLATAPSLNVFKSGVCELKH